MNTLNVLPIGVPIYKHGMFAEYLIPFTILEEHQGKFKLQGNDTVELSKEKLIEALNNAVALLKSNSSINI